MISASTLKKSVQDKRVLIDSNIIIYLTDKPPMIALSYLPQ